MIITGVQPTGMLHLGNYLGAILPAIALQRANPQETTMVFVADQHAITADFDPSELKRDIASLAVMIVAAGFAVDDGDPHQGRVFRQSSVRAHVELAHILGCTAARFGALNRMTQFREKMNNLAVDGETPSVGLFTYPVLQAADILLYQEPDGTPTRVPVGDDQSQHLNLVGDIAQAFNHRFGQTFTPPVAVMSSAPRIMSLTDPTKKMSKSDPSDMSRINLNDTTDTIAKKFRKAVSETEVIDTNYAGRPALRNLLTIYANMAGTTAAQAAEDFAGKGFGPLKAALTDATIARLEPISARYRELLPYADMLLRPEQASAIAEQTMERVRLAVGLD